MSTEDQQFEELLEAFRTVHEQTRMRSLKAHMDQAKKILESETDGLQQTINVKHAPISTRLKDAGKALQTLKRRQEDRKQLRELKKLVHDRGQNWEEYCKEWSMEDKMNEAEPFTSVEQMFDAMHDLAGIRISVYFPTDIPKVVEFLKGSHFITIGKPSRKGGLTRDFQKVRKLVERQRQFHAENKSEDAEVIETIGSNPELTFPGYKATHVVVRLRNLNFDRYSRGDLITNIEVQIGSIVMHAWSDIEHDILYKPSEKEKPSTEVVQMLDLINGIVMTGEVALKQLSRVAAAQVTRLTADRTRPADDWHDVAKWVYMYFKEKQAVVPRDTEGTARYLFEILEATNEHNYGRVEAFLNEVYPQPQAEACSLLQLLRSLGAEWFDEPSFKPSNYTTTWSARYWATCLVNTVNLALYMDRDAFYTDRDVLRLMDSHYSKNKSLYTERPTFAEFVDVLHPSHPQRRSNREFTMIKFCKHCLATNFDNNPRALTAVKLAAAGYVVRPSLSKDEEKNLGSPPPVFVPAMLKWLTTDHKVSFEIILSLLGDEVHFGRNQYFIPRREDRTWKPVRREFGKRWVVTNQAFSNDEKLAFKDIEARKEFFTDSLCNALGVKTDPARVRELRDLALTLNIGDDEEKLRYLARSHKTMDAEELRALRRLAKTHGIHDLRKLKELRKRERDA